MKNTQKYKILIDRIKRVVIKYKFELFGGFCSSLILIIITILSSLNIISYLNILIKFPYFILHEIVLDILTKNIIVGFFILFLFYFMVGWLVGWLVGIYKQNYQYLLILSIVIIILIILTFIFGGYLIVKNG